MADARGAEGAGAYPTLADNPRLAASAYPIFLVLKGRAGMPAFQDRLSDQQVADVVNYIRSHFGNQYPDTVNAADVGKLRYPPGEKGE